MKACSTATAALLASPPPNLQSADLFTFTLADGVTLYRWTSYDVDLLVNGNVYSSRKPWLARSRISVSNTMQLPTLEVFLRALNDGFSGGIDIKGQITNGLFDGASATLDRVWFAAGTDVVNDLVYDNPGSAGHPGIRMFGGLVGDIDIVGNEATIGINGKSDLLNQYMPRNLYQLGCLHAFCDAGCTLNRASFTTSYTVGSSPSRTFIPWSGSPPANAAHYRLGTVAFTSGPCSGQRRTVRAADSAGLTLIHPLIGTPVAGDGFTAFEGCTKALSDSSGQDCTARSNTQNWRAFPYVPPADTAF